MSLDCPSTSTSVILAVGIADLRVLRIPYSLYSRHSHAGLDRHRTVLYLSDVVKRVAHMSNLIQIPSMPSYSSIPLLQLKRHTFISFPPHFLYFMAHFSTLCSFRPDSCHHPVKSPYRIALAHVIDIIISPTFRNRLSPLRQEVGAVTRDWSLGIYLIAFSLVTEF